MSTALDIPTISVVICAYTERRYAELCAAIRSVQRQSYTAHAIVVVIDHCPALYARVRVEFPDLTVIENSDQQGLSGARNCGIAQASGAFVAFLDDDAEAEPDWLQRLYVAFNDPQVMAVGGRIEPEWPQASPRWFPAEFLWVVGCSYKGLPTTAAPVRNAIGANMAFRREVFAEIGGFRTGIGRVDTLPMGCEETELSIRAHQQWPERTILYEPAAVVHHHVTTERSQWSYFMKRCYAEGLSKAAIARLVGAQQSLASERAYMTRTLPGGVWRNLMEALRDAVAGFARAFAIVLGLLITALGYLVGKVFHTRQVAAPLHQEAPQVPATTRRKARGANAATPLTVLAVPNFHARRIIETEISEGIPAVAVADPTTGKRYDYALGVIRLHHQPLGMVELTLGEGGLTAQQYANQIWQALQSPINEHLSRDGLPSLTGLDADGITMTGSPLCLNEMKRFLKSAPFTSVILSAHGDVASLRRALKALVAQNYPRFEIIVADSSGTLPIDDIVLKLPHNGPPIRYVKLEPSGQVAALHRQAIKLAGGKIIAFTDDIAAVDRHWLAQLVRAFDSTDQVACVTGLVLPQEFETPAQQWFEEYGGFSKGFARLIFQRHSRQHRSPLYPFNAGIFGTGISMAFTAAFLLKHGGFDAALDASNDLALFRDVITSGATLVYEPNAMLYYQMPRLYTDLRQRLQRYGAGLGAYVAQSFLTTLHGWSKLPQGIYYLLSPWSGKNRKRSQWYPRELLRLERRSMLRGGLAYVGARLHLRRKTDMHNMTVTPLDREVTKILATVSTSTKMPVVTGHDTALALTAHAPVRGLVAKMTEHRTLLMNGLSMVATTGVTSLLGFAYWWLAARHFTPDAVGLASALVSIISLVGLLCMFGFGTMLMGELPRDPARRESLLSASLLFVAGAAGACGLAFAALAPIFSPSFAPLRANLGVMLFFALAVSLSAVSLVVDQALIGLLLGGQQLWRNTVFAVAKLALLLAAAVYFGQRGGLAIFATWVAGFGISLALLAIYGLARRGITRQSLHPDWPRLRQLGGKAAQHHILNSIMLAANQLLPVIVTITLSVRANAWFYLSFSLSNLVFMVGYSLSTALYAVNAADTTGLRQRLRVTMLVSLLVCLVANLVVTFAAAPILGIYGHAYAVQGAWSLRLLCLGALPEIIHMHYVALQRINNTMKAAMIPLAIGGVAEILFAVIGAHVAGLTGLCLGWVVALVCEALYMAPPVFRALDLKLSRAAMPVPALTLESQLRADAHDTQPIGQQIS